MTHASGITGSDELAAAFGKAYVDEGVRALKVSIVDEILTLVKTVESTGDEESDYDDAVVPMLEELEPCYIFYRLDEKNSTGFNYLFICYSPDFSHVRKKMVYASTRSTLKTLFGTQYIKEELFGTTESDVCLNGFQKHKISAAAPPPLTDAELEKKEIRAAETGVEIGASTKKSMHTGVSLPVSEEAFAQLEALRDGSITFVQLSVDLDAETINLERAESLGVDDVAATIPDDHARYNIFTFKHNHEGDQQESIVFVYSCPGYKCSIKERMLYSSCKGPLLDLLEGDMKMQITKRLEIGESADFTQPWLYEELHPTKQVFTQKFARPPRPGRKGGARLTRPSRTGAAAAASE